MTSVNCCAWVDCEWLIQPAHCSASAPRSSAPTPPYSVTTCSISPDFRPTPLHFPLHSHALATSSVQESFKKGRISISISSWLLLRLILLHVKTPHIELWKPKEHTYRYGSMSAKTNVEWHHNDEADDGTSRSQFTITTVHINNNRTAIIIIIIIIIKKEY